LKQRTRLSNCDRNHCNLIKKFSGWFLKIPGYAILYKNLIFLNHLQLDTFPNLGDLAAMAQKLLSPLQGVLREVAKRRLRI